MRLINVETLCFEEFFHDVAPPYAILSHTWGTAKDELTFRDVRSRNLKKEGIGAIKLEGCCRQAKEDNLNYVWIDTCCIDKDKETELSQAINSMFRWYRNAAVCYAYLCDVPPDDDPADASSKFPSSRWFKRGWTLQELLAPSDVRFYNSEWGSLGSKNTLCPIISDITTIPRLFLLGLESMQDASIAQRMSWAASRVTTRKEDSAYCLLGIFGVTMPMIYGEEDAAFGRLQAAIMDKYRDDSMLAWGLSTTDSPPAEPPSSASAGALAHSPKSFANSGDVVPRLHYAVSKDSIEVHGPYLQLSLPVVTGPHGQLLGLLNCGSRRDPSLVVGIPLVNAASSGGSDEYIRPQGQSAVFLPKTETQLETKLIYIDVRRQAEDAEATKNGRNWFYVEANFETYLELAEVEPAACWRPQHFQIMTEDDAGNNIDGPKIARFRSRRQMSQDLLVILEPKMQDSQMVPEFHVMTCSKDTDLDSMRQLAPYLRSHALGRRTASYGDLVILVTVEPELIAKQSTFAVRLHATTDLPDATINADFELELIKERISLVERLEFGDLLRYEIKQHAVQVAAKNDELLPLTSRLAEVEDEIRKLTDEKDSLTRKLTTALAATEEVRTKEKELEAMQREASQVIETARTRLDELIPNCFEIQRGFDCGYDKALRLYLKNKGVELDSSVGLLQWASERGYEGLVALMLQGGDPEERIRDSLYGHTPLTWAACYGYENIVDFLLDKGADIECRDTEFGQTTLMWAAEFGQDAVVRRLVQAGADIEARDSQVGRPPFMWAARKEQVETMRLLLEQGAEVDSRANGDISALHLAAQRGKLRSVQFLLDHQADIESKDVNGCTPLVYSAKEARVEVTRHLIERGADINMATSNEKLTPLHAAVLGKNEEICKLLLHAGADRHAKSKDGRTPMDWALDAEQKDIANLLVTQGTDSPSPSTPDGKLPDGKLPDGKPPGGKLPGGKLPDGKLSDGKLSDGKPPDGNTITTIDSEQSKEGVDKVKVTPNGHNRVVSDPKSPTKMEIGTEGIGELLAMPPRKVVQPKPQSSVRRLFSTTSRK